MSTQSRVKPNHRDLLKIACMEGIFGFSLGDGQTCAMLNIGGVFFSAPDHILYDGTGAGLWQ